MGILKENNIFLQPPSSESTGTDAGQFQHAILPLTPFSIDEARQLLRRIHGYKDPKQVKRVPYELHHKEAITPYHEQLAQNFAAQVPNVSNFVFKINYFSPQCASLIRKLR